MTGINVCEKTNRKQQASKGCFVRV